jgi:hypothetical protein
MRARLARIARQALTDGMRITKHEHACLRLEREGSQLIIDPGSFTLPLQDLPARGSSHPRAPRPLDARAPGRIREHAPGVPSTGPGVAARRRSRRHGRPPATP